MPLLPLNTHGLRWFDDSPSAGDPACICSHCDQVIGGETVLRLWNATGQEARLHQRCFAIRSGAPPETDFIPIDEDGIDLADEEAGLEDLGPCCACRESGPTVRNIVTLPYRAPEPGTGWGCVVCGLPSDGAIAVVCDACLEAEREIVDVIEGYATRKKRLSRDLVTEPFDHRAIPH